MDTYGKIDSKFRFVIIAAKRAKQLLKGAKPRVKSKSKNLVRIAQSEVKKGLVDYEIIQIKKEEMAEPEEESYLKEETGEEIQDSGDELLDDIVLGDEEEEPEEQLEEDADEEFQEDLEEEKEE